jgi:F-BAR domain only protein
MTEHLTVRINNFPNLEAIGPNRTFIHPVSDERPDEFTIDISSISPKSAIAFTYKVHVDDANLVSIAPLLLKPAWKPQGDKLALVVEYCLNSVYSVEPVLFHNLVLVATYTGARATGCQTKPTGTHLKEKSLVYWRLGDLSVSHEWHKVICRFVGAPGAVPEPGRIEAKWEVQSASERLLPSGLSLSRLEAGKGKEKEDTVDPFADDSLSSAGHWISIETSKKLVAGKYEAQ